MASEARWRLGLDVVRLVPAGAPPHKAAGAQSDGDRRAAWLEAALAGASGLEVSRIELEREGPSYTADTLEAMARGKAIAATATEGAKQLIGETGVLVPVRDPIAMANAIAELLLDAERLRSNGVV